MIDEAALEAMVDETVDPYRGQLDEDVVEEMRLLMLLLFESHPVVSQTTRAAYPHPNAERSGERGEDDAEDPGKTNAGGSGP